MIYLLRPRNVAVILLLACLPCLKAASQTPVDVKTLTVYNNRSAIAVQGWNHTMMVERDKMLLFGILQDSRLAKRTLIDYYYDPQLLERMLTPAYWSKIRYQLDAQSTIGAYIPILDTLRTGLIMASKTGAGAVADTALMEEVNITTSLLNQYTSALARLQGTKDLFAAHYMALDRLTWNWPADGHARRYRRRIQDLNYTLLYFAYQGQHMGKRLQNILLLPDSRLQYDNKESQLKTLFDLNPTRNDSIFSPLPAGEPPYLILHFRGQDTGLLAGDSLSPRLPYWLPQPDWYSIQEFTARKYHQTVARRMARKYVFGVNFQAVPSTDYSPVTTDIGLWAGRRLTKLITAGAGIAYKMGLGWERKKKKLTNQGFAIRSFVDARFGLFSSWSFTGAMEYDHQKPALNAAKLQRQQNGRPAVLFGLSKSISMRSSILSRVRCQVLVDLFGGEFDTSPGYFRFRVGYDF